MKGFEKYAWNRKVDIYVTNELFDCSPLRQIEKPTIILQSLGNKFPSCQGNVDALTDFLTNQKDPWETLPEAYKVIQVDRSNLFKEDVPVPKWVMSLSHVKPRFKFDDKKELNFKINSAILPRFRLMSEWCQPYLFGEQPAVGRPIVEYALFEQFCEEVLGPSLFYSQPQNFDSHELIQCRNEEESIRFIKQKRLLHLDSPKILEDLTEFQIWFGLNNLYPDLNERLNRVKEFQEKWYPEEIFRGRKSYEDTRDWLKTLKN